MLTASAHVAGGVAPLKLLPASNQKRTWKSTVPLLESSPYADAALVSPGKMKCLNSHVFAELIVTSLVKILALAPASTLRNSL